MPPKALKRPGSNSDATLNPKRARFEHPSSSTQNLAAEAADQAAFDEQVLAELEAAPTSATRRGAIKTDGYDSDSSDDGEGVVPSRRSGAGDAADEDDDMFAPSSSTGSKATSESKKKREKFLALGDIEGQEFTPDVALDAPDGLDDDDFEDEDAKERKLKEGMGFEISSFNMKAEMEEGKFAEDGTFHRTFDPHGVHDKWMEGIDDREMRKARHVKKKMEERERQRLRHEEDIAKGKDEITKDLVCLLDKGETVLEALQRLGKGARTKSSSTSKHPRKGQRAAPNDLPNSTSLDLSEPVHSPPSDPTPIERITALASTLMSLGNMDIYEETYESLLRAVRRSGIVPPNWSPPARASADAKYEYRWSPAYLASSGAQASPADVFGPFGKDELTTWKVAAYFGENGEHVQLRECGRKDWRGWEVVS